VRSAELESVDAVEPWGMSDRQLLDIGARLRDLRRESGWSGRELARRAGVPQSAVSRVENGQRVGSPTVVEHVIAALPLDEAEAGRLRTDVAAAYAATAQHRVDAGCR
jgi:transcriptional regulator with XRE-family HTH domain